MKKIKYLIVFIGVTAFMNTIAKEATTQEISNKCEATKEAGDKVLACNSAVVHYAMMEQNKIPPEAEIQANKLIELRKNNMNDDLYIFGIHDSYQVLGRIALKKGDLTKAKDFLAQSLKVKKTPALEHRGPRFTLARELLEKGEKKAVLDYFDQAQKIWIGEGAQDELNKMREEVKAGRIPKMK